MTWDGNKHSDVIGWLLVLGQRPRSTVDGSPVACAFKNKSAVAAPHIQAAVIKLCPCSWQGTVIRKPYLVDFCIFTAQRNAIPW